jgi:branched-chain amino acid transport system ATP-binding protein
VRSFIDIVKRIRDRGVAVLLVEQNLEIALALAQSCIVLAAGRAVWEGTTERALANDEIKRAYFA